MNAGANAHQSFSHNGGPLPTEPLSYLNVWHIVGRRKGLIALCGLLGLFAACGYFGVAGLDYETIAQILVVKKHLDPTPISGPTAAPPPEEYLATHQMVVSSPRIVEDAIRKHHLDALPSLRAKKELAASLINALSFPADPRKKTGGNIPTNILNIALRGKAPEDCKTALDAIVASYQDFLKEKYPNATGEMLELVTRARDILRKDLESKEAERNALRQQAPPAGIVHGKDSAAVQARLFGIEQKRTALNLRRAELEATLAAVEAATRDGRGPGAVLELLSRPLADRELVSPALLAAPEPWKPAAANRVTLEAELVDLQLQEAKLLESFGPRHPEVQGVRRRIEAVHRLLVPSAVDPERSPDLAARHRDQVAMKLHLLHHELDEARRQERSLADLLAHEQKEAQAALLYQAQDEALARGLERATVLYETVVKRLQELTAMKDSGGFDTEIIAPPEPGKLMVARLALILGTALVLGLAAGLGLGSLLEQRSGLRVQRPGVRSRDSGVGSQGPTIEDQESGTRNLERNGLTADS